MRSVTLFSFYRAFRTVFFIFCVVYALLIYTMLSDSGFGITDSYLVSQNIPHSRIDEETDRESIRPENVPKFPLETENDINDRYWELIQDSKSNNSHFQLSGDITGYKNISEYALAVRNLWSAKDYSTDGHNDRILAQLVWSMEAGRHPSIDQLTTKKILLSDTFTWWNFKGNDAFTKDCPGFGNKCQFLNGTLDYTKFLSSAEVDAVVTSLDTLQLTISDQVLRFYFILESPLHGDAMLNRPNDILASFWRESHLVTPYRKWTYYNLSVKRQKQEINYAAGKTKLVAIIISNCNTLNNRFEYVKQLQKHTQVDVYGRCGLGCPRKTCLNKIKKMYKFYLSFENSNCRDYMTEKFFMTAFDNEMVPIVMGAHPSDYIAGAPENSYIHIEDFTSPQALAKYLQYLDDHVEEYNKYFEWKGLGEFIDAKFLCRACAMTHYAQFVPPPKRDAVFKWAELNDHNLCLSKNQTYWNLLNKSDLPR